MFYAIGNRTNIHGTGTRPLPSKNYTASAAYSLLGLLKMVRGLIGFLIFAASCPVLAGRLPTCNLSVHLVSNDGSIAQHASLGPGHVAKIESKGKDITGYDYGWSPSHLKER